MAAPVPELSARDQRILRDLDRVRLLSGSQMERLHFATLNNNSRGSARRRTLGRLERAGLVTTLSRRVGGVRAGSAGLIYCLDARAQRQRWLWDEQSVTGRVRRPWAIGSQFIDHTLDVAELYVRCRERDRQGDLRLLRYSAEPASWHGTGVVLLKPDAYVVYEMTGWEQHRWIEVDRATESLPTLRRKLCLYVEALRARDTGPAGVLPCVVITVPDHRRLDEVSSLIRSMTDIPDRYFTVKYFGDYFRSVQL